MLPRYVLVALLLAAAGPSLSLAQTGNGEVAAELSALVTGPDGYRVGPMGLTAGARGITAIEPSLPVLATQPRIVLVGGLDGSDERK